MGRLPLCRMRVALLACCLFMAAGQSVAAMPPLRIYTEEWPPVSFSRDGQADGMAVELVRALQQRLGAHDPIQVVPWARGYAALLSEPFVMLFTVGRSDERERLMTLVGPVAVSSTVLLTRKGEADRLLRMGSAIHDEPVGAYRASIFADAAMRKGFQRLDLSPTPQVTAQKLLRGRIDLWSEGSFVVPGVLQDIGHGYDEVEQVMVLESLELYLAFSKGTPAAVVTAWENALRAMKQDGSFRRIYLHWFPHENVPLDVRRLGLVPPS